MFCLLRRLLVCNGFVVYLVFVDEIVPGDFTSRDEMERKRVTGKERKVS